MKLDKEISLYILSIFIWKIRAAFFPAALIEVPKQIIGFAGDLYKSAVNDENFSFKDQILKRLVGISKPEDVKSAIDAIAYHEQLQKLSNDFHDLKNSMLLEISNNHLDKLTHKTDQLFGFAKDIEFQFKQFLEYRFNSKHYLLTEILDFADYVTGNSLQEFRWKIEKMHEALVDLDFKKQNIVNMIAEKNSTNDFICLHETSPQQLIIKLFDMVLQTHLKGLMIVLYCYNVKETAFNHTFQHQKTKEYNDFKLRIEKTFQEVKSELRGASREIIACDPKKHTIDVTYTKLDEVFQGYLVNEGDLTRSLIKSVLKSCSTITDDKSTCHSSSCKQQPQNKVCKGRLRNCETINKPKTVCYAPGDRKYEWLDSEDGFYGRYKGCVQVQNVSASFLNVLHYCFCTCENEDLGITRYFSLLDAVSDVKLNKVVTGVRLKKFNKVIYIQIQEGKLIGQGKIEGTPEWKNVRRVPLLKYIKNHDMSVKGNKLHAEELIKNQLFTVSYENSTVLLDDIFVENDKLIVTGLRFRGKDNVLMLEIRLTPFDYSTGKLNLNNRSYWMNRDDRPTNYREEINLKDTLSPTELPASSIFSRDNQYFNFQTTSVKRDLAQFTIPFIDIREVVTKPPMPLSGVGLYHKSGKDSGGFMGLKIIHYDYSNLTYKFD